MRLRARTDANQKAIVNALRSAGCSVEIRLSGIGVGVPDLLVGLRGQNFLLEVKDGTAKPSRVRLRAKQVTWQQLWRGHVDTVYSIEDALRAVGLL